MRQNLSNAGLVGQNGRRYFEGDWYGRGIPANVQLADSVYLNGSYGFGEFFSEKMPGMTVGTATGFYENPLFIAGPQASIDVGSYTVINGTVLICNDRLVIGNHCMTSWQTIITDTWPNFLLMMPEQRRLWLEAASRDPERRFALGAEPRPVIMEDNCWVGFGSVIMPGVHLGYGCIVASKTVVTYDVPPYAVVAGNPARIVRYLNPADPEDVRKAALR